MCVNGMNFDLHRIHLVQLQASAFVKLNNRLLRNILMSRCSDPILQYELQMSFKFHQSNSLSCEQIHSRILCVELNDDDDDDGNDDDDNCSPKLVESESGVRKLALARIAAFTRNHQASLHQTRLHDILASNQTLVCLHQYSFHFNIYSRFAFTKSHQRRLAPNKTSHQYYFHSLNLFYICLHQKPPNCHRAVAKNVRTTLPAVE